MDVREGILAAGPHIKTNAPKIKDIIPQGADGISSYLKTQSLKSIGIIRYAFNLER
jgi:hypothetical protein